MIAIRNLYKRYSVKDGTVDILKNINLDIFEGLTYIVGESGSGKSTLLNIIAGIDQPSSGDIFYDGNKTNDFSEKDWSLFRNDNIGFVFQNFNLIEHLNAQENIEFSLQLAGVKAKERSTRAKQLLKQVNMTKFRKHKPKELSGGQKQRIAIARAIANNPKYIFADEPTGALDTQNSDEIMQLLKNISLNSGTSVVVITHSTRYLEMPDYLYIIKDGQIKYGAENDIPIKNGLNIKPKGNGFLKVFRNLKFILSNLWKTKARTIFSSFGASVGIFGILLISFLVNGLNNQLDKTVSARAKQDTMLVSSTKNDLIKSTKAKKIGNLQSVKSIYDTNRFSVEIATTKNKSTATAVNIPADKKQLIDNYVQVGQPPLNKNEIAISKNIATKLFGSSRNAINKVLPLKMQLFTSDTSKIYPVQQQNVTVTGVYNNPKEHQSEIELSSQVSNDYLQSNPTTKDKTSYFTIVPKSLDDLNSIKSDLKKNNLTTDNSSMETIKGYLNTANIVIAVLSSISLIISTILICVVMYIGITERKREIGIMKAIGATPRTVRQMFLLEGGLIGGFGGLLGLLGAVSTAGLLNKVIKNLVSNVKFDFFQFNLLEIGLLLMFSILLGIFGAYFPAKSASELSPQLILKYE